MNAIREFKVADGQELILSRFIAPAAATFRFASALNRSVTSSMSDLVDAAQVWLTQGSLPPYGATFKINEMPMSSGGYRNPREAFRSLRAEQLESECGEA